MRSLKRLSALLAIAVLFAAPMALATPPSTGNYQLNSFGFGSGGGANNSTGTYALEGITGEVSNQTTATATYTTNPGYIQTQQANVPKVTLTNPSSSASSLHFVIDTQSNPTDALYALQISTTSDFSSGVTYVQSDDTIGPTLTTADYQNYAAWGNASGTDILGLSASTTYYIRAKATQHLFSQSGGRFTESQYGPSSNSTTTAANSTLSFCIYTVTSCSPANLTPIAFGALTPGSVTNGPNNIHVEFSTNASGGGTVYVYSANGGLKSANAGNYLLASNTANLDSSSEGFGAQVTATGQTSGGPMTADSPYNSSGDSVGALATNVSIILDSSRAAVTGGTATIQLKVLASNATPAAIDYSDTLTFIAAAAF